MDDGGKGIVYSRKLIAIFIFIFTFLLFTPSLKNDFIWDDVIEIQKQYFKYQKYSLSSLIIPPARETKSTSYYRPVFHLSYVLDYSIWTDHPYGFHLTNIILYALSCVLLYFLILLILKECHTESKEYIALMSVVYFSVHPMHVESVSWIAGRTDILCGLFFIAAFISHIKSHDKSAYILLSIPLFCLSLLSKEVAVSFPFVVLFHDILKDKKINKKTIAGFAVYLVILVVYLFIRNRALYNIPPISPGPHELSEGAGFLAQYLNQVKAILGAYLYYFVKIIFPFSFNSFITDIPKSAVLINLSTIVFISLFYIIYRSLKDWNRLYGISIVWVVLTLGPSVLVAIFTIASTRLAERYLFLPVAGFSIIVGYIAVKLCRRSGRYTISYAVILIFMFAHIFLTINRQYVWRDRLSFWKDASSGVDDNAIPLINYGMALIDMGKPDLGIEKLEMSLNSEMQANNSLKCIAANNLGIAYLGKGKLGEAEKWFKKGVSYNPEFRKSYFHLGLIHYFRGRGGKSIEELNIAEYYFREALEKDSSYARAYFLLAKIYVEYGKTETARDYAGKALEIGLEKPLDDQARKIINKR